MKKVTKRSRSVPKQFFVDKKENQALKSMMDDLGTSNFSDFVRTLLFNGEIIKADFSELYELRKDVNRIGVNINQIAKHVNQEKSISHHEYYALMEDIKKMKYLISQKIKLEEKTLQQLVKEERAARLKEKESLADGRR